MNGLLTILILYLLMIISGCQTQTEDAPIKTTGPTLEDVRLFNAIMEVSKSYYLAEPISGVGTPIKVSTADSVSDSSTLGEYQYHRSVELFGDIVTKKFGVTLGMPVDSLIKQFGNPDRTYSDETDVTSYVYLTHGSWAGSRVTFDFKRNRYFKSIWEP